MTPPSEMVSPGLFGFLAFFFMAVALWLLMRNMNARMQRMSYAARKRQEELEARMRGEEAATPEGADDTDVTDAEATDAEVTETDASDTQTTSDSATVDTTDDSTDDDSAPGPEGTTR